MTTFLAIFAGVVVLALSLLTLRFRLRHRLTCMCCGRTRGQVSAFISGPELAIICDRCVRAAVHAIASSVLPRKLACTISGDSASLAQRCSFCRKSAEETEGLVLASSGAICRSCVELCVEILAKNAQAAA